MAADSAKVDHNMALKGKTFDLVSYCHSVCIFLKIPVILIFEWIFDS